MKTGKENLLIYLGIDEFNNTIVETGASKDSSFSKLIVNRIGAIMCTTSKSFILVPFFTGTAYEDIRYQIYKSTHPPLFFSLPIFSLDNMKTIVRSIAEQFEMVENFDRFEVNSVFLFYLFKIGQIPRALELFLFNWKKEIKKYDQLVDSYIRELFIFTTFEFEQRYIIPDSTSQVLPFAILNEEIDNSVHRTIANSLFERGVIQLQNNLIENIHQIFMPHQRYLQKEMQLFNEENNWSNWEQFCLLSFVMKVNSHIELHRKQASIKQLFGTKTISSTINMI